MLLGELPHEDLAPYYASCKVHALVSWMETTGLSSLEAEVMGANLVITDKGDTRDYLGVSRPLLPPGLPDVNTRGSSCSLP